jgi:hypothetical protein
MSILQDYTERACSIPVTMPASTHASLRALVLIDRHIIGDDESGEQR